jgi:hypothetical protein
MIYSLSTWHDHLYKSDRCVWVPDGFLEHSAFVRMLLMNDEIAAYDDH